jgi:hypothetical protein
MARQHLHDLRNIYAVLTDILHKNIAKVGSNALFLCFIDVNFTIPASGTQGEQ